MPSRTAYPASGSSTPRRLTRSTATTLVRIESSAPEPDSDDSGEQHGATSLDEPAEYSFKPNELVWVRNNDKWISGRIFLSAPKVRPSDNLPCWNVLYQDKFGHKLRKYFAPLLGELKPDTARVREMLKEAAWI
ncbi:hypothetical protein MKEN_01251900 [Mycena kentingensis (nom. inval.)]|nr:hypothetical protein MKEN_01251900 [Mycena kentingensis (nom. inval.)]